jgi:hypothetical protein
MTTHARLDTNGTAAPLTRLVGHAQAGACVGPSSVAADAIEDTKTRERTELRAAVSPCPGSTTTRMPSGNFTSMSASHAAFRYALAEKAISVEDWVHEVKNGDTRRGYDDWVKAKQEEAACEAARGSPAVRIAYIDAPYTQRWILTVWVEVEGKVYEVRAWTEDSGIERELVHVREYDPATDTTSADAIDDGRVFDAVCETLEHMPYDHLTGKLSKSFFDGADRP